MTRYLTLLALSFFSFSYAQEEIPWDGKYQLTLIDFQSGQSQIGNTTVYSLHGANGIEFSFQMSVAQFMFTKNFNSKVKNNFRKSAAVLVAPDSVRANQLVNYARYEFDLAEVYARKFRKNLYENKSTFSNVDFVKPIYDDLQKEFIDRDAKSAKMTKLGQEEGLLKKLHEEVLAEIEELKHFCSDCKSPKKSK